MTCTLSIEWSTLFCTQTSLLTEKYLLTNTRATSNYRFDQNEVNPVLASTNNSKLCYCKPFFWRGGGGAGGGGGGYVIAKHIFECFEKGKGKTAKSKYSST